MDKYQALISDASLYPPNFVQTFGVEGAHWSKETPRERELSLRHDMICALISNLEKTDTEFRLTIDSLKRKAEEEAGSMAKRAKTISSDGQSDIDIDDPDIDLFEEFRDPSEPEESGIGVSLFHEFQERERAYRFVLLEAMPGAERIQRQYAVRWGIQPPVQTWDLIDTVHKKFVEVKVTGNLDRALEHFQEQATLIPEHSGLIVCNPIDCTIHLGNIQPFQGAAKVINFLNARKMRMEDLNLRESDPKKSAPLHEQYFPSPYFNNLKEEWVQDWWSLRYLPDPPNYDSKGTTRLERVTAIELLDNLANTMTRDAPTMKMKYKFLPDPVVQNIISESSHDIDLCKEMSEMFLPTLTEGKVYLNTTANKGPDLLEAAREGCELVMSSKSCFSLAKVKRRAGQTSIVEGATIPNLAPALGVNQKKMATSEDIEPDMLQPEYTNIPPARCHPWLSVLMREMAQKHSLPGLPFVDLTRIEEKADHPLARAAQESTSKIIDSVSKTHAAIYMQKIINVYSRLGGSYLARQDGKSNHQSIASLPIYSTIYTPRSDGSRGTPRRAVSGLIFRGPHHAKDATDRINLIVVELLNTSANGTRYWEFMKNSIIVSNPSRTISLCIRQTAVMKVDSSHLTFIASSLFVPINTFGNLVLDDPMIHEDEDIRERVDNLLEQQGPWIIDRLVEAITTAVLGDSQSEALTALHRQTYLMLYSWNIKKKPCFSMDLKGYCDKINETLIDNPWALTLHEQFRRALERAAT
uniref:Polymerase PA n=1 Tax=Phasmatodean orthomyxo-related virus OKIAV167 TaxID=2746280 RepID=A0A7D7IW06_9ORTO|nr:polymerase PA [Phasmatodean orthomyxo-related virus OKIAV167]